MKIIDNPVQLLVRAHIPAAGAAHAVQLAKLIEEQYRGVADVVDALDGRQVMSRRDLMHIRARS
jgi:hypothetical protein